MEKWCSKVLNKREGERETKKYIARETKIENGEGNELCHLKHPVVVEIK